MTIIERKSPQMLTVQTELIIFRYWPEFFDKYSYAPSIIMDVVSVRQMCKFPFLRMEKYSRFRSSQKITTIHNGLCRFDDRDGGGGAGGVASYGNLRYYSARWRDYEPRFLHALALAWNEPDRYARTMFYMALEG